MSEDEIYVFELHPRHYGFFKTRRGWEKRFPPLSRKSTYMYTFRASKDMIPTYRRLAKKMRVDCLAYKREYARSNSYRAAFLKNHPPVAGKYRCWYCGRRKKEITVDHIYPVKAVQTDERLQKKLQRKGITNVNDERNLALSCEKCNKRKAKKIGDYPRRASFGRHELYWKIVFFVRIVFTAVVMGLAVYTLIYADVLFSIIPPA